MKEERPAWSIAQSRRRRIANKHRRLTKTRTCKDCGQIGADIYWPREADGKRKPFCWGCIERRQMARNERRVWRAIWVKKPSQRAKEHARLNQIRAAERGADYKALVVSRACRKLKVERAAAKAAAKNAWRWWLSDGAPDDWMRRYYDAMGKPWRNPRLSSAEQYRVRYSLDKEFRARERQRAAVKKMAHPEIEAAYWNRYRMRLVQQSDGTVTQAELGLLIAERSTCPYCGCRLRDENRAIDHMDPVSLGGKHSMANLIACCRSCNGRKAGKPFSEWILDVPEQRRGLVSRVYASKHGAPYQQACLL